jgi:glycosyltransferase involved in cell wall biosynthesis
MSVHQGEDRQIEMLRRQPSAQPASMSGEALAPGLPATAARRTMHLLFCCESYYPGGGGVQEVMRQIAERMAAAGHHVVVATGYLPERDFEVLNGVEVRQFKVSGNLLDGPTGEVDRYREFVAGAAVDAILIKAAQQWTFDALWPVLDRIAARKVFIPCGFSGLFLPRYADYFARLPAVLRKFDHLIFYAQSYRDIDFARRLGLAHLSVLPNGASELEFDRPPDPDFRRKLGIGDGDFVFLTIGNPITAKGHREVAEAYARLDTGGRPTTLILNGSWPRPGENHAEGQLEGRAEPRSRARPAHRLVDMARQSLHVLRRQGFSAFRARLTGAAKRARMEREIRYWIVHANAQGDKRVLCTDLSRPDLVQAYMAADLFVFASTIEYSPLVLFEAAAAGTPFLSVPVGNAEEIAFWTGGGTMCPAAKDAQGFVRTDPSVLAREMQRCMDDPGLLARLGATGKASWRREFTWAAIAPRYEAILAGCVTLPIKELAPQHVP